MGRLRAGRGFAPRAWSEVVAGGLAVVDASRYPMSGMQVDSPTIQRLRNMLLERAGLQSELIERGGQVALDDTSPEVQALIERIGPMCEVLYLVMISDGESDADEIESIRGAILTLTAGGLSPSAAESMLRRYAASAAQQGPHARLMRVAAELSTEREDAEAAFALAAAVAMADGSFATAEESLLVELRESLGISSQRAAVILDTTDCPTRP